MTRKHLLSIIIPCYNCEDTLPEAVDSVFVEKFTTAIEVILVDDGSTDATPIVIRKLKKKYPKIKILSQPKNSGGGAARNIGIQHAKGDLLFCLDSDETFESGSLKRMITFLDTEKLDGVAFADRKYFFGKNKRVYSTQQNPLRAKSFTLDDIFSGSEIVFGNFLFTKSAFEKAGGYPEHHGFDTQAFEARFLSRGLRVRACPKTYTYHRQRAEKKSYFERVYELGEFSRNYYLIFEDFFHVFSEEVRQHILQYDLSKKNDMEQNLFHSLELLYKENPETFFIQNKEKYLTPNGFDLYCHEHDKSNVIGDICVTSIQQYKLGEFDQALLGYLSLLFKRFSTPTVYWLILRCATGFDRSISASEIEKHVQEIIAQLQLPKRKSILREPLSMLIFKKVLRSVQKKKL